MSGWRVERFSISDKPYRPGGVEQERQAMWDAFETYLAAGWEPFAASTVALEGGGYVYHYHLRFPMP